MSQPLVRLSIWLSTSVASTERFRSTSGASPWNRYAKNYDEGGFWFSGNAANGAHSYLAINPLKKSKMSPTEAMAICRGRIGMIFPGGAVDVASPEAGAVVIGGHQYRLTGPFFEVLFMAHHEGIIGEATATALRASETIPPVVDCIESVPLHFTFQAQPHHLLVGTALHGVFRDKTGMLWMYQQGRGVAGEMFPRLAYFAAHNAGMWIRIADNLRHAIGN